MPRESVLLPKSARLAEVHYFPPRPQDTRALISIGSSANVKDDEAKPDNKTDKYEKAVDNEKSKDEKAGDNIANDQNSKSDPAKDVKQKHENPQDENPQAKKPKDDKSKPEPTKTVSPPLIFYLNVATDLGGWVLSDAIEEIKSDTAKGSLEPKMDKFIEDDCCG